MSAIDAIQHAMLRNIDALGDCVIINQEMTLAEFRRRYPGYGSNEPLYVEDIVPEPYEVTITTGPDYGNHGLWIRKPPRYRAQAAPVLRIVQP